MNDSMKSGIYQIRNIKNGKVYVGQTNNFTLRRSVHFRSLLDNKHYNAYLQRSFNKYGEQNFVFEILERCDLNLLNEKERHWIEVKQSEYADKGFNAAYAYVKFKEYDNNRRINKSKRKPVKLKYTESVRRKFKESITKYWNDERNRIKVSQKKSEIDVETVARIKTILKEDLEINPAEIASLLRVSKASVEHISNLASHTYILKEYNYIIKNRTIFLDKRKNRIALRMYREGCSYREIGERLNLHHRNAIRRINKIKTENDDRCRLNVIMRSAQKKTSLVRTLSKMGYNDVQMSKLLKASRAYIGNVRKGILLKEYTDISQIRGKVECFEYRTADKCTIELITEKNMQLAFAI